MRDWTAAPDAPNLSLFLKLGHHPRSRSIDPETYRWYDLRPGFRAFSCCDEQPAMLRKVR
jgi:hypothetical protein